MKHKRFEENILVDEAYTNYGKEDKNEDVKKGKGIAKNFAESLEYDEKKKWYHQLPEEPPNTEKVLSQEKVEEIKKEASSALHGDTLAYETKSARSGSSDHQWARTLLNKGAIGDRVAAATLLIQDNPVHNLTALRNLVGQVKPAKKRDGIVVIDALSELLISELLIPEVKLRTFEQHPLGHIDDITSGNKNARRNVLKLWYYEDQLKELYGTYVEALNKFAHDSVEANKEKAVSAMSHLLMHHPEREKMLLTFVINKLGDPHAAVASKAVYHLCQLLFNHPNMKEVVLGEIEKMLFRTNISPRAQYYGVCFLNQFFLGKDDAKIAESLIRIYFSFFKASIKTGEIDTRLMSAILTGVKRAHPFTAPGAPAAPAAHTDAIYRLAHLARYNVSVGALSLLLHVSDGRSDRFYTALYRKLTHPDIFTTSHSALLFSLIYKAMKQDTNIPRVIAFVKRCLQLCLYMTPAQACGMLFLISQVLKDENKKDAVKLVWTKRDVKDEVKAETTEVIEDEAEVDRSAEAETEATEKSAEEAEAEAKLKAEVKRVDLLRGDKKDLLTDDEEETYIDLKVDDEGNVKPKRRPKSTALAGWHHARVRDAGAEEKVDLEEKELASKILMKRTVNMDKKQTAYDPLARNPAYCGAASSAYLELVPLAAHHHPAVRMFAAKLMNEQVIQYSGDPLKDFAGIRFLDRFVFKNPKKKEELEQDMEGGVKKVRGSHPKFAVRKNYTAKGLKGLPVNSASYLNEDASKIPVDEKFLYDFLQKRRVVKDSDDDDSDADSVNSDDFDKYLDTVTGARDDGDSDDELDFLSEVKASKQRKKKAGDEDSGDELGSGDDDDDEDDEIDGDDGGSDAGLDISADEDEPRLSGDEDELRLEDSDDDEDKIDVPGKKGKKMKLKLKGKDNLGSLFASAEEFSTLLEDTASNQKQGSSQAVSNTDNAGVKQMAWEEKRDRWIKGYNKTIHGRKGSFKKRKQDGGFKMAPKNGAKRKGAASNVGGKRKKVK